MRWTQTGRQAPFVLRVRILSAVVGLASGLTFVDADISASSEESVVILEPKPSTDPNDPLVSTENY